MAVSGWWWGLSLCAAMLSWQAWQWASWWAIFEESDFARSIPLGNRQRAPGFSLAEVPSLAGRIVLITGATSGIGLQLAKVVARAGAVTVLGYRSEARGQAALDQVYHVAPNASASLLRLDLSSRRGVEAAAAEFARRFDGLHVLVNNGGIAASLGPRLRFSDGVEECFQERRVNYLAHFQLTLALLPLLQRSAPSRIVHVSAAAHRHAPLHSSWLSLASINDLAAHSIHERYGMAELAQLAFSNELHRRLQRDGHADVLSNAVHPGIVATGLLTANVQDNYGPLLGRVVGPLVRLRNKVLAYEVADGALTPLYAACSPSLRTGGGYFVPIAQPWRISHPLGTDKEFGRALWTFSEELLARPGEEEIRST
ncbi:hypothetical protein AB1Y20_022119 [Prymnesium parvum]|uniref:Protochlorophyllide reductase n=1 Tax=Prymnesium parvum TaxID=97485 RepID=A0AB34JHW5_PRYPA